MSEYVYCTVVCLGRVGHCRRTPIKPYHSSITILRTAQSINTSDARTADPSVD